MRKASRQRPELRGNADFPSGGFTALMWAARNGHEAVLRRLLERGADPTLTNGDGASATIIAIVNDRIRYRGDAAQHGADANDGALYHAVEMHDGTTDMYALDGTRLRADHPNRHTALDVIAQLIDRGADPDKPVVGQLHSTSLCCGPYRHRVAVLPRRDRPDVEVLKMMIARGADLEWNPSRHEGAGRRWVVRHQRQPERIRGLAADHGRDEGWARRGAGQWSGGSAARRAAAVSRALGIDSPSTRSGCLARGGRQSGRGQPRRVECLARGRLAGRADMIRAWLMPGPASNCATAQD